LWWFIGVREYLDDRDANGTIVSSENSGTSWLSRIPGEPLTDESRFEHQYLSSMYWSLTTLMKTPWVGPDTVWEKVFASLAVVMGAILFAALLGNVTALVQTFNKADAERQAKLTALKQFTAARKVPPVLARKLNAYVDAEWTITSGLDDSTVLAQLPGQLRGNIVASIYKDTLLKAPLFSCCSMECAKALLLRLQPEVCLQKEVLIARDQLCQEVYSLMRGAMQIASAGDKDDKAPAQARKPALMFRMVEKPGALIGHIEPFQREVPRYPFLVTAVRQAHLVSLSRVAMLDVLSNFEGDDCNNLLRVLRTEHQNTVNSLTHKRKRRPPRRPRQQPSPQLRHRAPQSRQTRSCRCCARASPRWSRSLRNALTTCRRRASVPRRSLTSCIWSTAQPQRSSTPSLLVHLISRVGAAAPGACRARGLSMRSASVTCAAHCRAGGDADLSGRGGEGRWMCGDALPAGRAEARALADGTRRTAHGHASRRPARGGCAVRQLALRWERARRGVDTVLA